MSQKRLRAVSSWMADSRREKNLEDEFLECRLIVLKIVRYMKENHLTQKDLAKRLNVSPQYINKFLHGQDLDMKVSTILRYGRVLGIKLLSVPPDEKTEMHSIYRSIKGQMGLVQPTSFNYDGDVRVPPSLKPNVYKDISDSCKNRVHFS